MNIDRAFKYSVYLLPALSIIAMAVAEGSLLYVLAFLALPLAFYLVDVRRIPPLKTRAGNLLAISAFFLAWLDHRFISELPGFAMGHFLIIVQIVYLFMERNQRNYGTLFLMALVNFILASTMTTQLFFVLEFLLFIAAGIWTLVLFNVFTETRGESIRRLQVTRRWALGIAGATFPIVLISVAVFLLLPRIAFPPIVQTYIFGDTVTGFSEDVQLGDLAGIKTNPEKVMRIWLYDGNRQPLKLDKLLVRGIALEEYDGKGWRASDPIASRFPRLRYVRRVLPTENKIRERFEVEMPGVKTLFAVYPDTYNSFAIAPAVRGDLPQNPTLDIVSDSLSFNFNPMKRLEYQIEVPTQTSGLRPLDPRIGEIFLQLPDDLSPLIRQLAAQIAGQLKDPYLIAAAVEKYLLDNYDYTLDVEDIGVEDPLEYFLIGSKEGHCEYFATAMAVMLRCLGVPARIVNGFAEGEWNEVGGYYIIRQQDAHSWVEAHVAGRGWVTFDPTPPAGKYVYATGRFSDLRLFYDSLQYMWISNVVNYGFQSQVALLAKLSGLVRRLRIPAFSLRSEVAYRIREFAGAEIGTLLLAIAAIGFGIWGLRLARKRPPPRPRRPRARTPRIRFYINMLKLLRKKGFPKHPSWTPAEFARIVIREGGEPFRPAQTVTTLFCAVRYGAKQLTPHQLSDLRRALASIKHLPRRRPRRGNTQ